MSQRAQSCSFENPRERIARYAGAVSRERRGTQVTKEVAKADRAMGAGAKRMTSRSWHYPGGMGPLGGLGTLRVSAHPQALADLQVNIFTE
jgi:hypothetical protein